MDDFCCNCDCAVLIKQCNNKIELLMNKTFVLTTKLIAFSIPIKVFSLQDWGKERKLEKRFKCEDEIKEMKK